MADNLRIHRTKIIRDRRIILSTKQLQKGMIVESKYSPIDEEGKKGSAKKYMLLILNPSYKGKGKYPKVHALTLNNFSPRIMNQLAEKIGLRFIPKFQKMVGINISKLIMEKSSKTFYSKELRQNIDKKYGASYRTMFVKSFNQLILINYRFDKKVLLKYFLQEDVDEIY